MLAILLITLQVAVEVAVGGFLALFITDLTRQVTRGFLSSTGGALLVIGAMGIAGEYTLPDPSHFTDHRLNAAWVVPSLRLTSFFMALFLVYLLTVYLRPPVLHVLVGFVTAAAGVCSLIATATAFPTPTWGVYGSIASFLLSALTIGTVTTAMLLGHWYLVVPNLSTRPLLALLALLAVGFLVQIGLAGAAVFVLAGHGDQVASRHDLIYGGFSLTFWLHLGAGVILPLLVTGLAAISTRTRSLMSATGLLYVAVLCTLIGQVTGKIVFFNGNLPL
ncbi:MAG: hypothetical protein ABR573_02060 [Candidatus Dormibacteria bacterium]